MMPLMVVILQGWHWYSARRCPAGRGAGGGGQSPPYRSRFQSAMASRCPLNAIWVGSSSALKNSTAASSPAVGVNDYLCEHPG
jgi:hypothetical protein